MSAISVIIPVYNIARYLDDCVQSVLNQTFNDIEVILVDDGSTDGICPEMCDEYTKNDKRVKVIHKTNGGLMAAWMTGVENSTSKYICFVDGDDWIEPNMYEEMLDNLLETDADFVHTGYVSEKEGEIKVQCKFETGVIDSPINDMDLWRAFMSLNKNFSFNNYIWSKLFKREPFISCYNNVPDEKCLGEDRIVLTELLLKCGKILVL